MQAGPLRAGDPTRLGRYRIVGRIGEGGQGAVYLGETEGDVRVAVKVLKHDLVADTAARRRFAGEVELARQVSSFCIAEVLDADMDDERPYIVSEYVEGSSLHAAVLADGPRTGGALHRLAVGTVTALVAVHRAGIVHRDFKPHNVLLGPDGPRVIDFGIARSQDATVTQSSGVIGTVSYMSPEQIGGETVEPKSDLFSWAATIAFAATGRPLFGGDSVPSVLRRILYEPADLTGLPPVLTPILGACLEKDPARRPAATDVLLRLLGHDQQSTDAQALAARAIAETRVQPAPIPRPEQAAVPAAPPRGGQVAPTPADTKVAPRAGFPAGGAAPPAPPGPAHPAGRPRRRIWLAAAAGAVIVLIAGVVGFLASRPDGSNRDDLGRGTAAPAKPPAATGALVYRQDFNAHSDWDGYQYNPDASNTNEVATRGYDPGRGVYSMLARGEDRSNSIASPFPAKDAAPPLTNVAFGVTAQVQHRSTGTGEVGLTCRGDEDAATRYTFLVALDGKVRVVRQLDGTPTDLLKTPLRTSALGSKAHRLEAACRAAKLMLWVDGRQVVDVTDPDPLPGTTRAQLGLTVQIPDAGDDVLEVSFDDFAVYPA